jgi:hypothetical protein
MGQYSHHVASCDGRPPSMFLLVLGYVLALLPTAATWSHDTARQYGQWIFIDWSILSCDILLSNTNSMHRLVLLSAA